MAHPNPTAAHIERRLAWVDAAAAGAVCGDLHMHLLEADDAQGVYLFGCTTTPAMRNVIDTLHGGSAALVADQAMGSVANSMFMEDGHAPTSHLSVNFHRPIAVGEPLLVRVRIINVSRRQIHLNAEICMEKAPDKLCVSASSVFFRTGKE